MAQKKVSLKLLINTKAKKVLFAEAGKDFVDFLLNFLSMPIGTVIKILTKQGMVGCLGNLYDSVEKLSDNYLQVSESKDKILNPKIYSSGSNVPLLLPSIQEPSNRKILYRCSSPSTNSPSCRSYVTNDRNTRCPMCSWLMNIQVTLVGPSCEASSCDENVGFVRESVTYMIMDDLTVTPTSAISSITSLMSKFNVSEVGVLQEKVVYLGMDEGIKLLRASLLTTTVLTDVFLNNNKRGRK